MKKLILLALTIFAFLGARVQPVLAVNKESSDDAAARRLATGSSSLQKTVDTQSAVLKTLLEQTNDNVNTMKSTVTESQSAIKQITGLPSGNRFDAMATQMQALSESLEEAKARLSKLSEQMAQMQNVLTTLPASNPSSPAPTGGPPAPGAPPVTGRGLALYPGIELLQWWAI